MKKIEIVIERILHKILGKGIVVISEENEIQRLIMAARILGQANSSLYLIPDYPNLGGLIDIKSPPFDDVDFCSEMMGAKINSAAGFLENSLWSNESLREPERKLDPKYIPYLKSETKVNLRNILSYQIVGGEMHDHEFGRLSGFSKLSF